MGPETDAGTQNRAFLHGFEGSIVVIAIFH